MSVFFHSTKFAHLFSIFSRAPPSTPERNREDECARERNLHQMNSPTHRRERATAATASMMQNPLPAPELPLPLPLPHPHQQRLVGVDPFLGPVMPNPSPRDAVAAIRAQLAVRGGVLSSLILL